MKQQFRRRPTSWLLTDPAHLVGATLPSNGLTTVQLGSAEPGGALGDWATAVLPVVAELIEREQPVFFVESGGLDGVITGPYVRAVCGGSSLLFVHDDDDDIIIRLPGWEGGDTDLEGIASGKYNVHGCVPTLSNIAADLRRHDAKHGTSVVLLDQAHMLRPYWNVTDAEGSAPYQMPTHVADQWRAADLLSFAAGRETPTVAIWEVEPHLLAALSSVINVSIVHVVVLRQAASRTVDVTVRHRAQVTDPWSEERWWRLPACNLEQVSLAE